MMRSVADVGDSSQQALKVARRHCCRFNPEFRSSYLGPKRTANSSLESARIYDMKATTMRLRSKRSPDGSSVAVIPQHSSRKASGLQRLFSFLLFGAQASARFGSGVGRTVSNSEGPQMHILAFGDSLTEGK